MRCVNPDCSSGSRLMVIRRNRVLHVDKRRKGERAWTSCCRSIRWYDDDGKLDGRLTELVFCEECRLHVGDVEYKQSKSGRVKIPKVWHSHCSSGREKSYSLEAVQWLHGAGSDVKAMAKVIAFYRAGCGKGRTASLKDMKASFRKAILHLAERLKKDAKLDVRKFSTEVILGRDGNFGIEKTALPK